jgi:hypothetical protein
MMTLIARFLPSLLPGLGAFLNPWVLLVVAALAAGLWFNGYATGRGKLDDYIGKQATAAVAVVVKQGKATERVVTKYIKVAGKTKVVTETVEKEVIKYANANPGLCLDPGWRLLHDAAALNALPAGAGEPPEPLRAPAATPGGLGRTDGGPGSADGHIELRAASSLR